MYCKFEMVVDLHQKSSHTLGVLDYLPSIMSLLLNVDCLRYTWLFILVFPFTILGIDLINTLFTFLM